VSRPVHRLYVAERCEFCDRDIWRSVDFEMGLWGPTEVDHDIRLGANLAHLCTLPLPRELWVDGRALACDLCGEWPVNNGRYRLVVRDGVLDEARLSDELNYNDIWQQLAMMRGTGLSVADDGSIWLFIEEDDPVRELRETAQRLHVTWETWYDDVLGRAGTLAAVELVPGRSPWLGSPAVASSESLGSFTAAATLLRKFGSVPKIEVINLDSFYSIQFVSLDDALTVLAEVDGPEVYIGLEEPPANDWVFCITAQYELIGFGKPAVEFILSLTANRP
jgi:hypothetical protein